MNIYWIWLSTIKYVGPVLQKRLLAKFESPQEVYLAALDKLEKVPHLNKRAIESLLSTRDLTAANDILQRCHQEDIHLLTFSDPLYPQYAKNLPESPILFYFKGRFEGDKTCHWCGWFKKVYSLWTKNSRRNWSGTSPTWDSISKWIRQRN